MEVLDNFSEALQAVECLKSFEIFFYRFRSLLECQEDLNHFLEVVQTAES